MSNPTLPSGQRKPNGLISPRCPNCGSSEYVSRKPERFVAFEKDRVCRKCTTQYRRPTPVWGSAVFFLVGSLLAAATGYGVLLSLATANFGGMATNGFCVVIGLASVIYGVVSYFETPETPPPDPAQPK